MPIKFYSSSLEFSTLQTNIIVYRLGCRAKISIRTRFRFIRMWFIWHRKSLWCRIKCWFLLHDITSQSGLWFREIRINAALELLRVDLLSRGNAMLLRFYFFEIFAFCVCENDFLTALKSANLKYLPMDANLINDEKLFPYVRVSRKIIFGRKQFVSQKSRNKI